MRIVRYASSVRATGYCSDYRLSSISNLVPEAERDLEKEHDHEHEPQREREG